MVLMKAIPHDFLSLPSLRHVFKASGNRFAKRWHLLQGKNADADLTG